MHMFGCIRRHTDVSFLPLSPAGSLPLDYIRHPGRKEGRLRGSTKDPVPFPLPAPIPYRGVDAPFLLPATVGHRGVGDASSTPRPIGYRGGEPIGNPHPTHSGE